MTPQQAYDELFAISKEIATLHSIGSIIAWDRETYMPSKGAALRAEQSAYISGRSHRLLIDPRFGELLAEAETGAFDQDIASAAAVNLREWRRDYDRAVKVPASLVEEISRTSVLAQSAWSEARRKSEFAIFQPLLSKQIDLARQVAGHIGYTATPYDALLDEYEPGMTTAEVTRLFSALRDGLVPLVHAILGSSRRPDTAILHRVFPLDRQKLFGEAAAAAFGFDLQGGRLDTVTHPFCIGIGPGDVRITTRYTLDFFNESFFGVLHETGHGLYEQNLPAEAFGGPLGDACSMGMHESQSRLWENFVGRSRPYWRYFFPRAQQSYPAALSDVSADDFYFAVNAVSPSYIRVEADEVTYNLHIMLRFEIEQAIIGGDLPVADIPGVWNETFERYLGIPVADDAQGCLQDVHWSFGGFGYFPTYALGNLYAAQIFAAAQAAHPDLEAQIASGNFLPLLDWLKTHIYQHGRRYRSPELLRRVTGQSPSHEALLAYLKTKFGQLYEV